VSLLVGVDGAPLTAAPPVVERARVFRRTPNPAWVAELAALTPRSDVHSWLHLAWEPGDPWPGHAIERWVLWSVRPPAMIEPNVLRELHGPSPRSTGHYCGPTSVCYCPPHRRPDQWVGGAARLIDQREWALYREVGGYARRWWVVEGDGGGHLYRYTQSQSTLARLAGLPGEPPVAGSLPYADPDQRTWDAVRAHDVLTRTRGKLLERTVAEMDAEDRDEAIRVRGALADWMRRQSQETIEVGGSQWRRDLAAHRLASWREAPEPDYDADDEDFLLDVD